MRTAIIGSRNLNVDVSKYVPFEITEIVTDGARGIGKLVELFADGNNIPKLIIKPQYSKYGKFAPLIQNRTIVDVADVVIVIRGRKSHMIDYAISYARKTNKTLKIYTAQ